MKSAIYIEVKATKGENKGKIYPWAGYIYSDKEVNPKDYSFVKNSIDQWDNPVKVYKASEKSYIDTPGGAKGTDLVVLFDKQPEVKNG